MNSFKFNVQGSNPDKEPYEVQFFMVEGVFSAICDCDAGKRSQVCGHRMDILEGTKKPLNGSEEQLQTVLAWYHNSDLEAKVLERKNLEIESDKIKRKLESVRKEISKLLNR
jgi:uncharacterized Zn finger protein